MSPVLAQDKQTEKIWLCYQERRMDKPIKMPSEVKAKGI